MEALYEFNPSNIWQTLYLCLKYINCHYKSFLFGEVRYAIKQHSNNDFMTKILERLKIGLWPVYEKFDSDSSSKKC